MWPRGFIGQLGRRISGWSARLDASPPPYRLTRQLFLRSLALVYLTAFLIALRQSPGLIGLDGILPLGRWFDAVEVHFGGAWEARWELPGLFWFGPSELALKLARWLGLALSSAVILGYAKAPIMGALWLLELLGSYLAPMTADEPVLLDFLSARRFAPLTRAQKSSAWRGG